MRELKKRLKLHGHKLINGNNFNLKFWVLTWKLGGKMQLFVGHLHNLKENCKICKNCKMKLQIFPINLICVVKGVHCVEADCTSSNLLSCNISVICSRMTKCNHQEITSCPQNHEIPPFARLLWYDMLSFD
jgi:hypothetical protein